MCSIGTAIEITFDMAKPTFKQLGNIIGKDVIMDGLCYVNKRWFDLKAKDGLI